MPARRQAFRQADIARALKGALAAGMKPRQAEITAEGRILLNFEEKPSTTPASDFDSWKASRARAS